METGARKSEFDQFLDEWVRRSLSRGIRSFPDLLRSLPGVYPTEALRAVRRLGDELPVGWQEAEPPPSQVVRDDWPIEHPLDFDWRFTPAAARYLIERCPLAASNHVVLLGAPSLIREAAVREWQARMSIFDKNQALVAAIKASFQEVDAVCADLLWGDPVCADDASITIADPPWYPEYAVAFLWTAARLTKIGGRVLMSIPAEGTRPGIPAELGGIFSQAESFGLRLRSIDPGVLTYRTPPFERNALAAAGITTIPDDWRRGDLAEFVLEDKVFTTRPRPPEPFEEWGEVTIGAVRIKFRLKPDDGFRDPTLTQASPGDMLASVSRRDPARAGADIWTCGNRIFRCLGPRLFSIIVSAIALGEDVERAVAATIGRPLTNEESKSVRRAAGQATDLAFREERELADYGHRRHQRDLARAF